MNATQLMMHFDRLSEAPGAVPRLRRCILDLAVRGKLVAQDAGDEPAAELLKRIQAERARLVKAGKIKDAKAPATILGDVPANVLPGHWSWVPFGATVNSHLGGGTPSKANSTYWHGDIFWASVKDVGKRKYLDDTIDRISEAGLADSSSNLIEPGSLIVVTRMGLGKVSINRVPVAINQDLRALSLSSLIAIDYCYIFFKTHGFEGSGLTVKGIKVRSRNYLAFLSRSHPLAEQHRIVAKVDELMALCDQLEAAQQERERRRDRLGHASLQRLNQPSEATSPETQRDHARFHLHHLPRLTTRPEHIKALRQTILNLAVLGLLSEGNDWALESQPLKTAATLQNGYAFKSEGFAKTGIRLLRNTNVSHGVMCWDEMACLPIAQSAEYERFQLNEGDVVLSLDRPFIGTGTKVARVRAKDLPCLLLQRVGRFQLNPSLLTSDYLFLWIESPQFTDQIDPGRSNGVPHISSKQVESAEIFLPPLAEQHRIVAKVDELMALCDQLEAQLTTTQTDSRRLLEAVLEAALAPA